MPNHIHLLIKTPEPNLGRGMQHWLSGYANWYAKRNQRTGHLFQGRYKAFLVEDTGYYWNLSRYIHLNPCNCVKPLADSPDHWPHSSYAGYVRKGSRVDWIDYEQLFHAWKGEYGGNEPARAYRQYVKAGMHSVDNPFSNALRDWVLGSEDFMKRMIALAESQNDVKHRRTSRRLKAIGCDQILSVVAKYHEVDPQEYVGYRSGAAGREMAAYLCRQWTGLSLAKLSVVFGLEHPDSSSNLVRRAKRRAEESLEYQKTITLLETKLGLKTENQV